MPGFVAGACGLGKRFAASALAFGTCFVPCLRRLDLRLPTHHRSFDEGFITFAETLGAGTRNLDTGRAHRGAHLCPNEFPVDKRARYRVCD